MGGTIADKPPASGHSGFIKKRAFPSVHLYVTLAYKTVSKLGQNFGVNNVGKIYVRLVASLYTKE